MAGTIKTHRYSKVAAGTVIKLPANTRRAGLMLKCASSSAASLRWQFIKTGEDDLTTATGDVMVAGDGFFFTAPHCPQEELQVIGDGGGNATYTLIEWE